MPVRRTACLIATLGLAGWGLFLPSSSVAGTAVTCHGQVATVVGTPENDVLQGTPGRDVIAGLAGQDEIDGGGGRDLVCGGPGADEITLGDGNDTVWAGPGSDYLTGGTGADELHGGSGWDGFSNAGGDGTVEYGDAGRDDFTSSARVHIWAGADEDTVTLTSCVGCVVHGGEGPDSVQIDGGRRLRIEGGPGSDGVGATTTVRPSIVLDGGAGPDWVELLLDRPADVPVYQRVLLDLGPGLLHADTTRMRVGNFENAEVYGHSLHEVALAYTVLGTDDRNNLWAGQGGGFKPPVKLVGRGGNDNLHGADGDDLLEGGPGRDKAAGGFGDDTCVSIEDARGCELSRP